MPRSLGQIDTVLGKIQSQLQQVRAYIATLLAAEGRVAPRGWALTRAPSAGGEILGQIGLVAA
jgi:hypothetical protein